MLKNKKEQYLLKSVENWLNDKAVLLALIIVAIGFGFRLYYVLACYLNPDEALHVVLAHAASLKIAYLNSLTQAHPPLLTLLLYPFSKLGTSEMVLRMPSLIAGTLGLWFGFRWAEQIFGRSLALGTLIFLTFSPAMAFVAIEVRQYGLLLGAECGALYALERSLRERSLKWLAVGHACLYAAILSHYSALWISVIISCYSLLRLYLLGTPRNIWVAWVGFQTGVPLLYVFLYLTHIQKMRSGWMYDFAVNNYLKTVYYNQTEQSLSYFVLNGVYKVFSYMLGSSEIGFIGVGVYLAGVISLLLIPVVHNGERRRDLTLLLILPVILGFIGAVFQMLPFGGSRHISYLLPFAAAGISFALLRFFKYPAMVALILGLFGPFWLVQTMPAMSTNNHPAWLPRSQMEKTLIFLASNVPTDRPLIVDSQTSRELEHYLGRDESMTRVKWDQYSELKRIGGRLVLWSKQHWHFNDQNFMPFVSQIRHSASIQPGEKLWGMSTGWLRNKPLKNAVPKRFLISEHQFGYISLVKFIMPSEEQMKKK